LRLRRRYDISIAMSNPPADPPYLPAGSPFLGGLWTGMTSVFVVVIVGSYISIGAFAHDLGFSSPWLAISTVLVWAAPAQIIIISALATGAAPVEIAIAVTLSAIRLLPMVVAHLPVLKSPTTPFRALILPAHFTAISMWIESLRLSPRLPREQRIAFANGIGVAFMSQAVVAGVAGHYLASLLPTLFVSALLFLTPLSFLASTIRNSRLLSDRIALVIGLVMTPLLTWFGVGLDLLWTGLVGGTAAYLIHRLREAAR
jgi:predicted branched-subunit amino acid permease